VRTEHVEYLLPDYLSKMLEESLRPWVESHLEECGACRAELENLRGAFSHLDSFEVEPPHDGYFTTVLPRVRERLQGEKSIPFYSHPLFTRFAVPLAAGALLLVILFRVPFALRETDREHNPLQPVVRGLENEEVVEAILDQFHRQAISAQGENETSALLAVPLLRSDHLLAGADQLSLSNESVLDVGLPENLDQLSASDVDILVARLGERTML
jgi:hypothetical protein